ncbi:MAG: class II glutamine amidotransferase [Candidatus Helarchaeota archaeon]
MCELLGLSFNLPVKPNISFIGFRKRSKANPHGWGVAYYPDKAALIIKEPIKATDSLISKFIAEKFTIQSKIFIAHVRKASVGRISYKNTHPFSRELNGREYVFIHNGTIFNYKKLKIKDFKPIGNTDSEHFFCYLLQLIKDKNIRSWEHEDFKWLNSKLNEINNFGKLNIMISDGRHLFCYKDKNETKSLYYIHRKFPFPKIHLRDEDWDINLADIKDPKQEGYVISSKPLTDEPWEAILPSDLLIFKNGRLIFSNS